MTASAGALFERLLDVMTRLRGPSGCPWDREQTPLSLTPYLIEEAYEVLEALDGRDDDHLQEELGDLLFQVVFHCQIAAEQRRFTMADVLARLATKMIARHPHVFGDANVRTPGEALAQWEALKQREAAEAGRPRSAIDGVPRTLPALLRAQRVQAKAAGVRFDWPDARAAWDKVQEEMREVATALAGGDRERMREEVGDLLFSVVNAARLSGLDAEDTLRAAIDKFQRRFTSMEAALTAQGRSVASVSPEELEHCWEAAKAQERRGETFPD